VSREHQPIAPLHAVVTTTAVRSVLTIAVRDGGVMIDNAHVVKTDIATSNGVIHVMDTVLLPAAK
jgi:uncharacterized surface protein with fasciclin (FAS1) repeats